MPIYEYRCTNGDCGHELEALQKISDEPLVFCPSCGESSLKKKISAAGFRLKGTGWYETDFKNNGKKPAAKSSSDESGKGDTKSAGETTGADSKSADSKSGDSKSGDSKNSGGDSGKSASKAASGGSSAAA